MGDTVALKEAVRVRAAMENYQDTIYLNLIRILNNNCQEILKEDLGSEFVRNCGRDLAGEVVRNCFDTSSYNVTVDQLAKRILEFSYENEYDPLSENGGMGEVSKTVYNYNELQSAELDQISEMMDESQEKLFQINRKNDSLDTKGKKEYRERQKDEDGNIYDDLTGQKGGKSTYIKNNKEVEKSDLQADHVQARESATYNSRYLDEKGVEKLQLFWNSSDNMQMMFESANASKGDVRVCEVDGKVRFINTKNSEYDPKTDITYKATPEQLADATIFMWEYVDEEREKKNAPKIEKLKSKGYLDENGKVPKAIRKKLIANIRHSQNEESKIILKNTDYKKVSKDALDNTKSAIGKVIAGQIIYYAAPPLVYELKVILKNKAIKLENALDILGRSAERIGKYVFSKLKDIFINIAANSIKKFIKSFMDILIATVKATIRKILKMAKNLVLSTADAIRIIIDPNADSSQKANAVFNLYGVTITNCVIEILFELAADILHIPEPFDDIIFGPLQILTTVVCTNLTLLILKKADLFDTEFGFKMSKIRLLFKETREMYNKEYEISTEYADTQIAEIIEKAKRESMLIYENLEEYDLKKQSARGELEKVNSMFSMNIDFESDWLKFLGIA